MIGTFINAGAILVGSIIGLVLHKKLPEKYTKICFQAIGIFILLMGIQMGLKSKEIVLVIASLVIGSIIGVYFDIDGRLQKGIHKFSNKHTSHHHNASESFMTAFLLFCTGSITILGPIEEGLGYEPKLLLAKSVLDGISAIAIATTLGYGILYSIIPLILFQGAIYFSAPYITDIFGLGTIQELTAVGGILLIGVAIHIMNIKQIKVSNMLPSLACILIACYLFG